VSLSAQLSKLYNLKRDCGSGWEKPYKPAPSPGLIDLAGPIRVVRSSFGRKV